MRSQAAPDEAPKNCRCARSELPQPRLRLLGKPVRASAAEVASNPRARSAVMRVAEKLVLKAA
jgi:16S rRNA (cytosine1402-N4)-methyltransferase